MSTAITNITPAEYIATYPETDHIFIDVREVHEYEDGFAQGAINIPLSELQMRIAEIPTDKPVVLICQRGGRSMNAAAFLAGTNNYAAIVNVDGGTSAWMEDGLPLG
ncbi:MAG: rhodanese-like domain-containing protein [Phototrophicaceae bacterium]